MLLRTTETGNVCPAPASQSEQGRLRSGSDIWSISGDLSINYIHDERKNIKHWRIIRRYHQIQGSISVFLRSSPKPEELVESCHQIMGWEFLWSNGCQLNDDGDGRLEIINYWRWWGYNYLRVGWSWQCQRRGYWRCCVSARINLQTVSLAETERNSRSFLTSNFFSPGK